MYYLKLTPINQPIGKQLPHIVWGHGWAQDHTSLKAIAVSLQDLATHWLLDFPGFGESEKPAEIWGTTEYAKIVSTWIKENLPNDQPIIWVGHSFGCRVGISIAAIEPKLIQGLFLIAAAGIPRPISLIKKLSRIIKIYTFKLLKHLCNLTKNQNCLHWLKKKFGSIDYQNADPKMRNILVKVINENLSALAATIKCPTELIYGSNDQETPPIIGEKLQKLIANSTLHIIPYQDHWSLLNQDIHQVVYLLKNFIAKLK